ncbi:hypothetical protein B0H21DRAFT_744377 [Amylocystis lapponica]|nr:hypothetical protein B0H21DRAFT_744377 [Amylocystis lapponica]
MQHRVGCICINCLAVVPSLLYFSQIATDMSTDVAFHDLGHDLIDYILSLLSDFKTLSAAILTSSTSYNVFQAHPKSIVRAIAHNVVGPDLRLAIRVVYLDEDYSSPEDVPSEADIDVDDISRSVAEDLVSNAAAVQGLEDLFSLRYKDRMSSTSTLSPVESLRFHRAVYRVWSWLRIAEYYLDEKGEEEFEFFREEAQRYLSGYTIDEVFEMQKARAFLGETVQWTCHVYTTLGYCRYPNCEGRNVLMQVPPDILVGYRQRIVYNLSEVFDADVEWTPAYINTLNTRRVDQADAMTRFDKAILDEVTGKQDACHRCQTVHGLNLWGRSTWPLLEGCLNLRGVCNQLPGNLPQNVAETRMLLQHIRNTDPLQTMRNYVNMLEELFDFEADPQGVWSKDEWYCLDCMCHLFKQRLWKWWLAKKRQLNIPVNEDCWYGYNCRTQTHRHAHASRLNVSMCATNISQMC